MICMFAFSATDFQLVPLCGALVDDQLWHRLHPEKARLDVPKAIDGVFPLGVPAQHALLQDLQLGQPYRQS